MSKFNFANEAQHSTNVGYWGPRTAAVDWCEPNFDTSYYIAEFWNTITSLPVCYGGLFLIYMGMRYNYDKRIFLCGALLALTGFGSALFHGTLLYTGQVLDEVPMVYTSTAGLYTLLMTDTKASPVWLAPAFVAYNILFTLVYLFAHEFFVFFLIMYIMGIVGIVFKCAQIYTRKDTSDAQKALILGAVGSYLGGFFFFWLPENFFCSIVQPLRLHAWFHNTSCVGSYLFMVFACYELEKKRGKKPRVEFDRTLWIPIPYVASFQERAAKER
jgi:dihydroceramidase